MGVEDKEQNIQVVVRLKPTNEDSCIVATEDTITLQSPEEKYFVFNKVFKADAKQLPIFENLVVPLIMKTLCGYNCTIFTYGQSGTGKTYTLFGENSASDAEESEDLNIGIIPRTFQYLFSLYGEVSTVIRVSYLQIHNDTLTDLIGNPNAQLRVSQDPKNKHQINVLGLHEEAIKNAKELKELLRNASKKAKPKSDKIFFIYIYTRGSSLQLGQENLKRNKLLFVDLMATDAVEKHAKKYTKKLNNNLPPSINALQDVIFSLIDEQSHIPYYESKLTRVLQDSLGGTAITSIIATCSTDISDLEETTKTLEFVSKTMRVKMIPAQNENSSSAALILSYEQELRKLNADLAAAKTKDGIFMETDQYKKLIEGSLKTQEELLLAVKEFAEFQEAISETERKLSELKDLQCMTEREVQTAYEDISNAKTNLKQLKKQRRLRQEEINRLCETQTVLTKNKEVLSQALESSVKDHDCLRDKVDVLYAALERNKENVENFCQTSIKHCEKCLQELEESENSLFGTVDELKEQRMCFIEEQKYTLSCLRYLNGDFLKVIEELTTLKNNFCSVKNNRANVLQAELELSQALADDITEKLGVIDREFDTYLEESGKCCKEQKIKNENHMEIVRQELNSIKEKLNSSFTLCNNTFSTLTTAFQKKCQDSNRTIESLQKSIKQYVDVEAKKNRSKLKQQLIASIKSAFAERNAGITNSLNVLNNQLEQVNNLKEMSEKSNEKFHDQIQTLRANSSQNFDDAIVKVTEIEETQQEAAESSRKLFECSEESCGTLYSSSKKMVKSLKDCLDVAKSDVQFTIKEETLRVESEDVHSHRNKLDLVWENFQSENSKTFNLIDSRNENLETYLK